MNSSTTTSLARNPQAIKKLHAVRLVFVRGGFPANRDGPDHAVLVGVEVAPIRDWHVFDAAVNLDKPHLSAVHTAFFLGENRGGRIGGLKSGQYEARYDVHREGNPV